MNLWLFATGASLVWSSVVLTQERGRLCQVVFADGTVVRAEVADTEPVRARGLMFRRSLAADRGMLFVFDRPGPYAFWMKNTLIPLDMLWLDDEGRIVSLAVAVPPCRSDPCPTYPPDADARYVLEVPSGFASQHRIAIGHVVRIERLTGMKN